MRIDNRFLWSELNKQDRHLLARAANRSTRQMPVKQIAASLILSFAVTSTAGAATVASYGDSSIANAGALISDLIPQDLDQVLDAAGLVIVLQYDSTIVAQDRICHAITGVSRHPESDSTAKMPAFRTVHTVVVRNTAADDITVQRQCTAEAIRGAVKTLTGIPIDVLLRGSKASVSDRVQRHLIKPAILI